MAPTRLECHNLCFNRGDRAILRDFNVALSSGEVGVVQGPNGSGKSTLIKVLAGVLHADEGAILYEGESIFTSSEYVAQRLYLGHKLALDESATVLSNIEYWADLAGNAELVSSAIHYFDLLPYVDMPLRHLSAGWQKRVALTRLITMPRKLWLLDEPFANLDDEAVGLLESLCTARKEQGGTILMSYHGALSDEYIKIININNID